MNSCYQWFVLEFWLIIKGVGVSFSRYVAVHDVMMLVRDYCAPTLCSIQCIFVTTGCYYLFICCYFRLCFMLSLLKALMPLIAIDLIRRGGLDSYVALNYAVNWNREYDPWSMAVECFQYLYYVIFVFKMFKGYC